MVDEMIITPKPGGNYVATGNAKLFIKSPRGSERFVATAVVSGVLTASPPSLTAKILINRGFTELPKQEAFIFREQPPGDYQFFASLDLTAAALMEEDS